MPLFLDYFLHIDRYLGVVVQHYGAWTYGFLFFVIFCETGLVVTPFLPGDSLLFAAGAFAALGSLTMAWLLLCLSIAAILGDSINYLIGRFFGEKVLAHPTFSRWIRPAHLERTKKFYATHGSRMIVLARFVPIVRTVAPFVAGISGMHYATFATYNVIGGLSWIFLLTLGGYFFGGMPIVKANFTIVIFVIIFISLLPALIEYVRHRRTPVV